MWRVVRGFEIHVAHRIAGHPKCGVTHGHSFQLTVKFKFAPWIDFAYLKEVVEAVVDFFDHRDLGNIDCETFAQHIKERIEMEFEKHPKTQTELEDLQVELFETSHYGVIV